jgi:hypothetical protein
LHHLIARLDDLTVEFEGTLRRNQVDQLGYGLNVGRFEKALADDSESLLPGVV